MCEPYMGRGCVHIRRVRVGGCEQAGMRAAIGQVGRLAGKCMCRRAGKWVGGCACWTDGQVFIHDLSHGEIWRNGIPVHNNAALTYRTNRLSKTRIFISGNGHLVSTGK